jgi:hypothetical protein
MVITIISPYQEFIALSSILRWKVIFDIQDLWIIRFFLFEQERETDRQTERERERESSRERERDRSNQGFHWNYVLFVFVF